MINYDEGFWAVGFIWSYKGSTIQKGLVWAIPSTALAVGVQIYTHQDASENLDNTYWSNVLSSYSFALSFLLVFRTQIAYSRLWDGVTYMQTIRATWANVVSSCFCFCTSVREKQGDVDQFQHHLVRLVSLLHGSAIQSVAEMAEPSLDILDYNGMDCKPIQWLAGKEAKTEIILQWTQRLIMDAHNNGILAAPPPILSRVFQELSNGMMACANAQKIKAVPFPFPYAQMITVMLVTHVVLTIIVSGLTMNTPAAAACQAFTTSLAFWCINYVAMEIEMPYGDDMNDLPLKEMQLAMNSILTGLLEPMAKSPPAFFYEPKDKHRSESKTGRIGSKTWSWDCDKPHLTKFPAFPSSNSELADDATREKLLDSTVDNAPPPPDIWPPADAPEVQAAKMPDITKTIEASAYESAKMVACSFDSKLHMVGEVMEKQNLRLTDDLRQLAKSVLEATGIVLDAGPWGSALACADVMTSSADLATGSSRADTHISSMHQRLRANSEPTPTYPGETHPQVPRTSLRNDSISQAARANRDMDENIPGEPRHGGLVLLS